VKLKGAQVKKLAGAGPARQSVGTSSLAATEEKKILFVRFTDEKGEPWGGLGAEVKLPDGSRKKKLVGGGGALIVGGVDPGDCEVSFPGIADPKKLGREGGGA